MGACMSLEPTDFTCRRPQCAYVILSNGQLRLYPVNVAVTVSEVLNSETTSPESFFLCNCDKLNFDEFVPALEPLEVLEPAQIYFLLPKSKLRYRISAADMADLAVKACVALEMINRRRRSSIVQISPVQGIEDEKRSQLSYLITESSKSDSTDYSSVVASKYNNNAPASKASSARGRISRARKARKFAIYSSTGTKLAIRSFKIRLNTIDEESELLN